jgi:hypothetical protein
MTRRAERGKIAGMTAPFIPGLQLASEFYAEVVRPLKPHTRSYYDRPYQVLDAGRFANALREAIADPQIRQLPAIGAVDQFIDSTDALGNIQLLRAAAKTAIQPGHPG